MRRELEHRGLSVIITVRECLETARRKKRAAAAAAPEGGAGPRTEEVTA